MSITSQFSVEIYQFLLPWQQGPVWKMTEWHSITGLTPKCPVWCKNLGTMLNTVCVMGNLVWIFPNLRYHGNRGWSGTNFSFTVTAVQSMS